MPNERNGDDERERNAPVSPVADRTERHIVKVRQLLREARSRLGARDDDAETASADPKPPADHSEQ